MAADGRRMSALARIKFGLICCGFVLCGASLSLLAPFYPGLAKARGLSSLETGVVMGTPFFITMVATPLAASLLHRAGPVPLLASGPLLSPPLLI
jgi:hypothetical protein